MAEDRKGNLLESAVELLLCTEDIDSITTRMIADRAGVNLALINYYYGSKDELLKTAVGEIMGRSSSDMYGFADDDDPVESIIGFFNSISRDMMRFRKFSSLFIPDLILRDRIELPDLVLPAVRKSLGPSASEPECRLAAYRMVVQAQIIFLRLDDVGRYAGLDLTDGKNVEKLLSRIVKETMGVD